MSTTPYCTSIFIKICYVIIAIQHIALCSLDPQSPGEITPTRLEIGIGDSANITCSMNLEMFEGHNSSSLYFVQVDTNQTVPKRDIAILNDSSIVYMIRNATKQNRDYTCKSGLYGVDKIHVSVGTAPSDVIDFQCRGYDYRYMVCTFTKPKNPIPTRYELSFTAVSYNYIQPCPLMEIEETQAFCNLTKGDYRPNYEFFNFTLSANNRLGMHNQTISINNYQTVVPQAAQYVFKDITINSVDLQWNMSHYAHYVQHGGLRYEVYLEYRDIDKRLIRLHLPTESYVVKRRNKEYTLKLTNLPYAYHWYSVSLRLRTASAPSDDENLWSDAYVRSFQTSPCAPYESPLTDVGSFYINIGSTTPLVRLYWQQLPTVYENGANFSYIISEVKRNGELIDLKPLHMDRISASYKWDDKHNYSFAIKSKNSEGVSVDTSYIIVPRFKHKYHELHAARWIQLAYHSQNYTYTLSWSAPNVAHNLIDYTVFWCLAKKENAKECEDTIHFQHINKKTTQFVKSTDEHGATLNFAVSANYVEKTAGLQWATCVADDSSELEIIEPEVYTVAARSIQLQWTLKGICPSIIKGYVVSYCRLLEDNNALNETATNCYETKNNTLFVDRTLTKFSLDNLKPFATYKIFMHMYSSKKVGKFSDALVLKTKEEAPLPPHNLDYFNVTSNSVILTWQAPAELHGNLRAYKIIYNGEYHSLNCTTGETDCNNTTIHFILDNLSSYTEYRVHIIAQNIEDSDASNFINFTTLIGIPSSPRDVLVSEVDNRYLIKWSKPAVPAGRLEFYEVILITYKNNIKAEEFITDVFNETKCLTSVPMCLNSNFRYEFKVRAVNLDNHATRADDVSANVFTTQYQRTSNFQCFNNVQLTNAAHARFYNNQHKYKQYTSVWVFGHTIRCRDPKSTLISSVISVAVIFSVVTTVALFYILYAKIKKMKDIDAKLPPELEQPFTLKGNGINNAFTEYDDYQCTKDTNYCSESRRLLSNNSTDICFLTGGGNECNIAKIAAAAAAAADEGVGANVDAEAVDNKSQCQEYKLGQTHFTEHFKQIPKVAMNANNDDNAYTIMQAPAVKLPSAKPPAYTTADSKYIPPGIAQISMIAKSNLPIISANVGGYVTPQMLQKPTMQSFYDGNAAKTISAPAYSLKSDLPHISGYVTQTDLSTFGHHTNS